MAAGTLPQIGTEYGPCSDEACGHRDCAQGRVDLERDCEHCGEPISLRLYYVDRREAGGIWVHATCEDAAVNPDTPPYR